MTTHETLTTGVFPAMVTPFEETYDIDHETVAAEAQRLEAAGVAGVVPVGSTGESATLTHHEHIEVVETVVDAVDDIPVIAGTGSNNTQEAIELSQGAADAGADAVLLISPYYNRPEPTGMEAHFRQIADTVDIPQIPYNVPGRTGRTIEVETLVSLAEHEQIIGYKAASSDLEHIGAVAEQTQDLDFSILSGDGSVNLPILSIGGTGAISVAANVVPGRLVELYDAALAGDYDTARTIHYELGPLFRGLFVESNPIPVKEALSMLGYVDPILRPPLSRLSDAERAPLRDVLQHLGLEPTSP